jgi:23S rRNA pseudouridine2605 synthase
VALIRLQRFLAMAGVASRRRAEDLIQGGTVRVNNRVVTELGSKVDPERDRVTVDGRRVQPEHKVYLLLNKPDAMLSTLSDPEGRPTVGDILARSASVVGGARVYPIGRLEFQASGALLLTNDGDLAAALLRPRRPIPKTYHVKVTGLVTEPVLGRLRAGVRLDDGKTPPAEVAVVTSTGKHSWLEITLAERRHRQVPRMCEAVGHPVRKLIRVAVADIGIEGLKAGELRELEDKELTALRELAGAARPKPMRARGRRKRERSSPGK